ncbi:MAG: cupin domain-containing protein [Actinomycetota bacterium]|nr:cupin domain-containing protein [Actinomycetota bacterium]
MEAIVTRPGEGEVLTGERRELRVKGVHPELLVLECAVEPGYEGPRPHFHRRHVDSFYVLDGELEFAIGGETVRAEPGTFVLVPPGLVHSFANPRAEPARFLNVQAPETGFVELLRERERGEEPDAQRFDVWDTDGEPRASAAAPIVYRAGDGRRASKRVVIKAGRDEIAVTESRYEPGRRGPEPHLHRLHADSFYVLEGELEFLLGEEKIRAPGGTFVLAPPRFVHTFWNPGPADARYLNFHAPGVGFDEYLVSQPAEGESEAEFLARFDHYYVDRPHPADM